MSQVIKMLTYSRTLNYDTGSSAMTLTFVKRSVFYFLKNLKCFYFDNDCACQP